MTMLHAMGLTIQEVKHLLVAGGFGTYLDIEKAVLIGLLPGLPVERFSFVGNASLRGARRTLLCGEYLNKTFEISRAMRMALANETHREALNEGWRAILGSMGDR